MKQWIAWMVGLAAALALAAPVLAQEEGGEGAAKETKPVLRGEYAMMAGECKMDDAQKAALAAAVAAKDEAMKPDRERSGALKKDLAAAKEAGDKEAVKRIGEEMKTLQEQQGAIETEHQAKILAVLTSEQRETWEGFCLWRDLMQRYRRAELADEQKAQVRTLANQAASEALAVRGDEEEARKAREAIQKNLRAHIEAEILTAEQKEKLAAPKPAAAEKAPAAEEEADAEPVAE